MRHVALSAFLFAAASVAALPAAAQDADAGGKVFRSQCGACHNVQAGGRNGVGPNLHGIVGRKAAEAQGFSYSSAMKTKGDGGFAWTEENLHAYLIKPQEVVPGTKMPYAGLRNEQQLNDLIAYLKSQS